MDRNVIIVGLLAALLIGAAGCTNSISRSQPASGGSEMSGSKASEKEDEKSEVIIKFADAPEAVRAGARKLTGEQNITRVIRESDEGITTYEIEYTDAGVKCAAIFTSNGDVMETERTIATGTLPAAASAAIKKEYTKATVGTVQIVTKTYYEVELTENGKTREIKVDAAGSIEDESGEKDDENDK